MPRPTSHRVNKVEVLCRWFAKHSHDPSEWPQAIRTRRKPGASQPESRVSPVCATLSRSALRGHKTPRSSKPEVHVHLMLWRWCYPPDECSLYCLFPIMRVRVLNGVEASVLVCDVGAALGKLRERKRPAHFSSANAHPLRVDPCPYRPRYEWPHAWDAVASNKERVQQRWVKSNSEHRSRVTVAVDVKHLDHIYVQYATTCGCNCNYIDTLGLGRSAACRSASHRRWPRVLKLLKVVCYSLVSSFKTQCRERLYPLSCSGGTVVLDS